MAPKRDAGGKGQNTAQNYVTGLQQQGLSEQEIRKQLKDDGYKAGRISQLLKATRPTEGQEGVAPAAKAGPLRRPASSAEATKAGYVLSIAFVTSTLAEAALPQGCMEAMNPEAGIINRLGMVDATTRMLSMRGQRR